MNPKDPAESYPLGRALDFLRRVSELNHALERVSSRMERTLGVTAQQRLVLRCVGKYPGITAGQLATVLHLDPGTVSASLRRLAERKLLVRRHDPRDKRRVVLGLTATGRKLDQPTTGTVEHAVQQLFDQLDEVDISTTGTVLARLSTLLQQVSNESPAPPTHRSAHFDGAARE
jgi:DNA-binding MarR family transcriptional regulator